jgi:hypothetical protein
VFYVAHPIRSIHPSYFFLSCVCLYPDTNDVSSASKVVALSIAFFRFNALTIQRFNEAL